jgi:hypothetical protein
MDLIWKELEKDVVTLKSAMERVASGMMRRESRGDVDTTGCLARIPNSWIPILYFFPANV